MSKILNSMEKPKILNRSSEWRPQHDNLFVVPFVEADRESLSSAIIAPTQSRSKPLMGVILETGPMLKTLSRGDFVVYGDFAGIEVAIDDGPRVLSMLLLEIIGSCPAGKLELVEHFIREAGHEHWVAHMAESHCEHCSPTGESRIARDRRRMEAAALTPVLDQERERMRQEREVLQAPADQVLERETT